MSMRFINGLRSSSSLSVDDADFSDELLSKGMTHSYRMLCDIVHPARQFPLVCVAPSSVCEGRGVYATTFISKDLSSRPMREAVADRIVQARDPSPRLKTAQMGMITSTSVPTEWSSTEQYQKDRGVDGCSWELHS